MQKRILGLGAVLVTVALAASSARAQPAGWYINPFASPMWQVSRTDMGVDWAPT